MEDPSAHLSLVTHRDVEPLQDLHDGQLHGHLSKPHPDAVPGPQTEGHVHVGVDRLLIAFSEPENEAGESLLLVTRICTDSYSKEPMRC